MAKPGPLTAAELANCKKDFKNYYRTYLCKIRADPLNPKSDVDFEELFTTLSLYIVDGDKDPKKCKQLNFDALLNIKVNEALPKRLILQGEAGTGKTTLCAKIAWDWITGRLFQEYEMVLVVPLREAEGLSIGKAAKAYLSDANSVTASQLTAYIQANPTKVLIILDGLDEFKGKVSGDGSRSYESGDLVPIIRSEQLTSCLVLVTSRPWKAEGVKWHKDRKIRMAYYAIGVQGFSKENLALYIKKFFKGHKRGEEKSRTLIYFTEENDVIADNMAPYPIYTAMLCLMWRDLDEHRCEAIRHMQTFSQVFCEMFFFLKEHYAMKTSKNLGDDSLNVHLKEITGHLDVINKIAFNGLLRNDLVFDEEDFDSCRESLETALKVGVMSQEKNIALRKQRHDISARRLQTKVVFPHKLFQEFMAGMHMATLFETDKDEYNRLIDVEVIPKKEEFKHLLYFAAAKGQTVGKEVEKRCGQDIVERLIRKFDQKQSTPASSYTYYSEQALHDDDDEEDYDSDDNDEEVLHVSSEILVERQRDFIVDVAFECQDPKVARVVKEKFLPQQMTLNVRQEKTAHTITGYLFLKLNLVGTLS